MPFTRAIEGLLWSDPPIFIVIIALSNAPASPAGGSEAGAGPLCMRSSESLVFGLAWHEFENRDFRRTVEPDGIDRPADPFRDEDSRSPRGGLEPARVGFVSHRQYRGPDERDVDLSAMRVAGNHEVDSAGELGVSSIRIVGKDNSAFGIGNPT